MKYLLFLIALFVCLKGGYTQTQDCTPLLRQGSGKWEALIPNKINMACIDYSSESKVEISVEYSGFKDKNYIIIGTILDSQKKPIAEIGKVIGELAYGSNSTSLEFNVKKLNSNYANPLLNSAFLEIIIAESERLILLGIKAIYKLERTWEIPGVKQDNSNIVIPVKLLPRTLNVRNPLKNEKR